MKNRLKELRMENNLTLRELGKQLRMKNSTLSQYEMERREPKIEIWKKIADFFHVPTEYLMGLTNDRVTLTINDLNPAEEDGTLKSNVFVDWIFVRCVKENKFRYAGLEIPDWMRGKL